MLLPLLEAGDLAAYDAAVSRAVVREAEILSKILDMPITAVSMHRPSPMLLERNLSFPGLINSYGKEYFHDCKYLSDSRRHWREPVEDLIASGSFPRLHILTHAFWYHETELSLHDSVLQYLRAANAERYSSYADHFRDLDTVVNREEIQ